MGPLRTEAKEIPMQTLHALFDLASARPALASPASDATATERPIGPTERLHVAAGGALVAVVLAGLWGLAAHGPGGGALANFVKVPMLLVVSGLAALPTVLLGWRLFGARVLRSTDMVVAYAVALFTGALVLAVLAPIVALYQHSSGFAGPYVAMASAAVAACVGGVTFLRALGRLAPREKLTTFLGPALVLGCVQLAALAQLASVTSPIFDHRTTFGYGIDALHHGRTISPPAPASTNASSEGETP
jgi:hypothetical protein